VGGQSVWLEIRLHPSEWAGTYCATCALRIERPSSLFPFFILLGAIRITAGGAEEILFPQNDFEAMKQLESAVIYKEDFNINWALAGHKVRQSFHFDSLDSNERRAICGPRVWKSRRNYWVLP
jgi:hypothetical protein